jgi:diguanylate cyclase (GGDEF)-like protein
VNTGPRAGEGRSVLDLTELIDALGDPDVELDVDTATRRIAEALHADVVAVCGRESVESAHGLDRERRPGELMMRLRDEPRGVVDIPGIGECHLSKARVRNDAVLLLARASSPFGDAELRFAEAFGRFLGLALKARNSLDAERGAHEDMQRRVDDNRRLVSQLRERQDLLDRLFRIQRSISHRAPTKDVLDAITAGASELLAVERVDLRLSDHESPEDLVLVSSIGVEARDDDGPDVVDVSDPVAGCSVRENRLVMVTCESDAVGSVRAGSTAMAAPVHVNGEPVGCLLVCSSEESRRYSPPEQEALLALAEHASLALQDARAIDAMRKALRRERHRAAHDPLTGLPNRVTVQRQLDEILSSPKDQFVSVLFVDLDRFKLTNDTLGHAFGDEVLKVVASRLRTSVREPDIVGRLSGDEFVVICENMSQYGALEMAVRIQTVVSAPIERHGGDQAITASVGIATAVAGDSAETLIANADLAMYRAKQAGRARIEMFDRELRLALEDRVTVGQDLRRALDHEELQVFLQPIVSLPDRKVLSFESLVRWHHPERGLLQPTDFIGLAEDSGLVQLLDKAVISETLSVLSRHDRVRPVAVNLSARTFADPQLIPWLEARFSKYGVDPSLLHVEVTETALMEQTATTDGQLVQLGRLGVKVLIDDFGTGYSSLAYLQAFPVFGVKIDRAFTKRLGIDRRADAIVAAVFNMAEALELTVVSEGVETDDQVQRLVELRDRSGDIELWAQGHLFGRPEPADDRLRGFIEVPPSAILPSDL